MLVLVVMVSRDGLDVDEALAIQKCWCSCL